MNGSEPVNNEKRGRGRPRRVSGPKQPAHVSRIEAIRNRLPRPSNGLSETFGSLVGGLSINDLEQLRDLLGLHVRMHKTIAAGAVELSVGDRVRILSGKHAGSEANVVKVQHIRCYVETNDGDELYMLLSDVEKV